MTLLYYYAMALGPLVCVAAVVLGGRAVQGRPQALNGRDVVRRLTVIASVTALTIAVTTRLVFYLPRLAIAVQPALPIWVGELRFLLPLAIGIISVILLCLPMRSARPRGTAELARRTVWTFMPRGLLAMFLIVLVMIVAVSLAAGAASEPDAQGHYRLYVLDMGNMTAGTGIYGWYHSMPALCALLVLLILIPVGMTLIARPALAPEPRRDEDLAQRRLRGRNLMRIAIGAACIHASMIWQSLSGTADLHVHTAGGASGDAGFAPLTTILPVLDFVFFTAGLAMWAYVLYSGRGARQRAHQATPEPATR